MFFGKGGIGKSTIASNITAILAAGGKKVLHIGCDPKMDSVISLMGRPITPFIAGGVHGGEAALRKSVHTSPITGVYCIEAGGPHPGVGCAGTGIGAMLDSVKETSLLQKDGYDAAIFDVLGDVVCGGFAAPLRSGFAKKAVLVVSEELLSLYAANNLIMMLNAYARNGVYLAGLVANVKNERALGVVRDFARSVNTSVLGVILWSHDVRRAEKEHRPVVLLEPRSVVTTQLAELCKAIEAAKPPATPPAPFSTRDFIARMGASFLKESEPSPSAVCPSAAGPLAARELFARAGFSFIGIASSQIICRFSSGRSTAKISIMNADNYQDGMIAVNDWVACIIPEEGRKDGQDKSFWNDLAGAARTLSSLSFDSLVAALCRVADFPHSMDGFDVINSSAKRAIKPGQQHMAFGQWYRFIFPNSPYVDIAPGSIMLMHGDSECRFNGCGRTLLGMFGPRGGLKAEKAASIDFRWLEGKVVIADFNAADAFYGDEAKLRLALKQAVDATGRGGLVEIYESCSPLVTGGGPGAVKDLAAAVGGAEMLTNIYNDFFEASPDKVTARARFMAGRLKAAAGRPSKDVNLTGFGSWTGEIAALLSQRGVSAVVPCGDFYRDAAAARLQVLAEPDPILRPAFDAAGNKWLLPVAAPYGFAGTRAWLGEVFSSLKRKPAGLGPTPALSKEMEELSRQAREFTVAFVLATEGEAEYLKGSEATSGLPLLPFLLEAGFSVRLLVFAQGPAEKKTALSKLTPLRREAGRGKLKIDFFSNPAELSGLLVCDGATRLVYSDITRDRRVAEAGRQVLHPSVFEPGYEGAVETVRRLLELCRCGFNEKYLRKA